MKAGRKYPNSHIGWHEYYVKRFNLNQHPDAAYLAMVYPFFHLAHNDPAP